MKKYFQIVGILALACFSFMFTEKTALMVRNSDTLMQVIKENENLYKVESVNASISGDTIIPGIGGKKVNDNKSYSNMKRLGQFNSNLLIYDYILPEITLTKTFDKYVIGGNYRKNMISIIIKIGENDNVDEILKIAGDTKINLFIDGAWLEKNESKLEGLKNYNIGNLSYNGDYSKSGFIWMNTIINKHSLQKNKYCYQEEKNEEYLKICALQKNYTILPSIIVRDNPLIEIKNNIKSGSIVSMSINDKTVKELPLIISYINSKGYKITDLDELLSEDY